MLILIHYKSSFSQIGPYSHQYIPKSLPILRILIEDTACIGDTKKNIEQKKKIRNYFLIKKMAPLMEWGWE
jgi:hypothetical protein